jgi:hypothetical protein
VNNVTNKPAITSGSVSVGSVSLASNALLNVSSGASLDICGNVTGPGSITGAGTITLSGSGTQTLALGGGKVYVSDLSIAKPSGTATVSSGAMLVSGTLSLSSTSSLATSGAGQVVLSSSSSSTGRLAQMPVGASLTGLTLERKLPATAGWYFVSAPFTSATPLSQWSELPARVSPAANANILRFSEDDSSAVLSGSVRVFTTGWRPPASLSSAINPTPGRGYRAYQNAAFISGGGKLSVTGTPNTGNVTAPFSFTPSAPGGYDGGGWNLLGNPYPSEIDWNAVKFDPTNSAAPSGNAINVYNGATKTYGSWTALTSTTGVSANGGSRYIASSQAFFIKSTGSGSLTYKESHKDNANPGTFQRTSDPDNTLRIAVASAGNGAGADLRDEAVLVFMDGTSRGQDRFDAAKLANDHGLSLAAQPVAGLWHSISVLPLSASRQTMPLSLEAASGSYTLTLTGLSSFAAGTRFYVQDAYQGIQREVAEGSAYSFAVSADPASKGQGRLTLLIEPQGVTGTAPLLTASASLSAWPVPATAGSTLQVRASRLGQGQGTLRLTDAMGRQVRSQKALFAKEGSRLELSLAGLAKGVYTLKAAGPEATATTHVVVE